MGPAYHKRVPLLGVPGITLDDFLLSKNSVFGGPFFSSVYFMALNPQISQPSVAQQFQFGARHFAVLRPENPERSV